MPNRVFVIGNGKSLLSTNLNALIGEKTYAVNKIWKLFNRKIKWRPTDYVRCEYPRYEKLDVEVDLREMSNVNHLVMHLDPRMLFTYQSVRRGNVETTARWMDVCEGAKHDWHLPKVCTYGTVITTAIQVAILDGATEICLIGCDLEDGHFYDKTNTNIELAYEAHKIAARCSPVPIYNCSRGKLDMYPEADLEERITDGRT